MVSYCKCGHDAQIHTPGGGYLQPGTPRGEGGCTALRCWCVEYVNRQAHRNQSGIAHLGEYDNAVAGSPAVTNDERNSGGVAP